jgi:hypothetical protein
MNDAKIQYNRKDQPALLEAAKALTGSRGWMPDAHALGAFVGDRLIAVAVFQNVNSAGAQVHFGLSAGTKPRRDMLRMFFLYAFKARRYHQIIFPIAVRNRPIQIMCLKSGGIPVGHVGPGIMMPEPAILYGMTRKLCRWIDKTSPETNIVKKENPDGR